MPRITAYCGRDCSRCQAYAATRSSKYAWMDTTLKLENELGLSIDFQGITCGGCKTANAKMIPRCGTCEIRQCCRDKGLDDCHSCPTHPCKTLAQRLETSPFMQTCLEVLTRSLGWTEHADGSTQHNRLHESEKIQRTGPEKY